MDIEIGNVFVVLREKKGYTLEQVAKLAGLKAARLERIEKGEVPCRLNECLSILSALGSDIREFEKLLGPPKRPISKYRPRNLA